MVPYAEFGREFFAKLTEIDGEIAGRVAAARCPHCQGPLHRGDYERKPRGGLLAGAGEGFARRHSLCCGRRGCRKRALPPSLRFLGRRVYLEAVVLLASVVFGLARTAAEAARNTGVPRRTLRRWAAWWTTAFVASPQWSIVRARFAPPPPADAELPVSLMARLQRELGEDPELGNGPRSVLFAGRILAPLTTRSVSDGARFLGELGLPSPSG